MPEIAVDVMAQKYQSLLRRTERLHVSYRKAVMLVGGEKRLERLMLDGKVRYSKPEGSANTMWRFNLADIVRNVKPLKNTSYFCEALTPQTLQ